MTRKYFIVIGIFIVSVFIIFAIARVFEYIYDSGIHYPKGLTDFNDTSDFEIDPNTILSDLNRGKTDVFKPAPATPLAINTPLSSGSYPWHQSDYLKVAGALHQFAWRESLDGWSLYSMVFGTICLDNRGGFDAVDLTYYKQLNGEKGYTIHEMEIYPIGGRVTWGGGDDFSRPLFGWKSINLDRMKVTADDALQIAEQTGGKEFRIKYNNSCDISILLKPNGDVSDWIVAYFAQGSSNIFEIHINPYTGEYNILPGK